MLFFIPNLTLVAMAMQSQDEEMAGKLSLLSGF